MTGTPPVPALVFGSGVTQLGVLRALGRAGAPALAVATARISCAVRAGTGRGRRGLRSIAAEYLGALPIERAMLIPCSDYWVARSPALEPGKPARFPACVPPVAAVATLVDKLAFAACCGPRGCRIRSPSRSIRWPTSTACPSRARRHHLSQTPRLAALLRPVQREGVPGVVARRRGRPPRDIEAAGLGVVLQEYIPGPASRHYYVEGFVDARQTVNLVRPQSPAHVPSRLRQQHLFPERPPGEVAGAVPPWRRCSGTTRVPGHLQRRVQARRP